MTEFTCPGCNRRLIAPVDTSTAIVRCLKCACTWELTESSAIPNWLASYCPIAGHCPTCHMRVVLVGEMPDGRMIGSCGDAFRPSGFSPMATVTTRLAIWKCWSHMCVPNWSGATWHIRGVRFAGTCNQLVPKNTFGHGFGTNRFARRLRNWQLNGRQRSFAGTQIPTFLRGVRLYHVVRLLDETDRRLDQHPRGRRARWLGPAPMRPRPSAMGHGCGITTA
jgi:hypothetical protein